MHQSIPAVPISHLLTLSVPGVGHSEFYCSPGPGHMPHVFESASTMDEFIGKDETFVKQWLVRQALEKLVDIFKGMFS